MLELLRREALTDSEGAELLGLDLNSYRPRRRQLELDGLVTKTGDLQLTSLGRHAEVWRAVTENENDPQRDVEYIGAIKKWCRENDEPFPSLERFNMIRQARGKSPWSAERMNRALFSCTGKGSPR